MESGDIILTITSTIAGGFIGGLTSLDFHPLGHQGRWQINRPYPHQRRKTRRLVNAVGHALANAGFKVTFDEDGDMVLDPRQERCSAGGACSRLGAR